MALLYYFAFNYAASAAFNGMASILAPVGTGTILIWLGGWSVGICVYSDIHWALSDRTFTPAWIWKCVFNWNEDFQPFFFIFVNMHDYLIFDQGRNLIQSGYVNSNPTFCTSPQRFHLLDLLTLVCIEYWLELKSNNSSGLRHVIMCVIAQQSLTAMLRLILTLPCLRLECLIRLIECLLLCHSGWRVSEIPPRLPTTPRESITSASTTKPRQLILLPRLVD